MSQVVQNKILDRIYGKGRGWVFTPKRFLDLGSRDAVDQALFRLSQHGTIRKLSRGLYDYPKQHPQLGLLNPDPDSVAKAISEKDEIRLQPSGAFAVNRLGLSQQVPAKMVYLTDGPEKSVRVGNQTIQLKRTTPKNMATAGSTSGLVIQAFRYLGKEGVTSDHIATLRCALSADDRKRLSRDRIYAPAWMHHYFAEISRS
ncbi:MAG TPA: DUF6088 family protein [Candidatus Udaeobacter sp.]|nr:DUF6088 family protein [Candidatus Udaeobacter sp.]